MLKHTWAEQANELLVDFLMVVKGKVWPKVERHNFAVRFFERDLRDPLLSEGLVEGVLSVQANKRKGKSGSKKQQQHKKSTVSVAAIDAVRLDLAFCQVLSLNSREYGAGQGSS